MRRRARTRSATRIGARDAVFRVQVVPPVATLHRFTRALSVAGTTLASPSFKRLPGWRVIPASTRQLGRGASEATTVGAPCRFVRPAIASTSEGAGTTIYGKTASVRGRLKRCRNHFGIAQFRGDRADASPQSRHVQLGKGAPKATPVL